MPRWWQQYAARFPRLPATVRPKMGVNVPGTGEKLVRLRTISSPVPGT